LEADDVVVAILGLEFVVRSTGKSVWEHDEVRIFPFHEQGKVASFCHEGDSYRHWTARRPA